MAQDRSRPGRGHHDFAMGGLAGHSSHEATTPADRYFVAIALKTARVKLTRDRQIIFDGTMPAGTLYVSAPSKLLGVQFHSPCAFLHFHISTDHFSAARPATGASTTSSCCATRSQPSSPRH